MTIETQSTARGPVKLDQADVLIEQAAARERERAARLHQGQQLYARIKKSSKYFSQNQTAAAGRWGLPFPVRVERTFDDYCVQGGPGGQYRLADVNLYVKSDDGRELKIS